MRCSFLISLVLIISACQTRLSGELDESQANEIIAVLDSQGIAAEKIPSAATGSSSFEVQVRESDMGAALRVLSARGLPRHQEPGVEETYSEPALVPTTTEERARYLAALAGDIAKTLERANGVVGARVHIAIPDAHDMPLDGPAPTPRASVLLSVRRDVRIADEDVRRLVAGSIESLAPEAVSVVRVNIMEQNTRKIFASVGPFKVAPTSAPRLRIVLLISFIIHLVSSVALLFLVMRKRKNPITMPES